MKTKKSTRIIYWITITIIFLFERIMPALSGDSQAAVEGVHHLGYPHYFRTMLNPAQCQKFLN